MTENQINQDGVDSLVSVLRNCVVKNDISAVKILAEFIKKIDIDTYNVQCKDFVFSYLAEKIDNKELLKTLSQIPKSQIIHPGYTNQSSQNMLKSMIKAFQKTEDREDTEKKIIKLICDNAPYIGRHIFLLEKENSGLKLDLIQAQKIIDSVVEAYWER